ncbi:hypothetical protein [Paenibacillus macquariensis]|nr:hypothetical protein [Paenibacillus macquariensis]MEC0089033.1 hypothetical protein [Paenibacillus macquariensis]
MKLKVAMLALRHISVCANRMIEADIAKGTELSCRSEAFAFVFQFQPL